MGDAGLCSQYTHFARPSPTLRHAAFTSRELGLWPTAGPHILNVTSAKAALSSTAQPIQAPASLCPDLPRAGDSFHTTAAAQSERHSVDLVIAHSCCLALKPRIHKTSCNFSSPDARSSNKRVGAGFLWADQTKTAHPRANSRAHTVLPAHWSFLPSSRGPSGRGWLPCPGAFPPLHTSFRPPWTP